MVAKDYLIQLILRLTKEGTGAKDISKELEGVDTSAKKTGGSFDFLGAALKGFTAASVAVTGAVITLKKAMEFGREGATIIQTGESFDYLIKKVGASTDLLDQLRSASLGTVDDMTLMSSTTTLLAGAQGELASGLANATPRLLEIAKAANKLNPSLGDTTFLYNSLATGIKRASPLILDNLGLTIKIGEANERYAKTIGKTVEQLTAEEQKMALLEETLRAGNVLVEQAGSSTESATDAYARFDATLKNLTDTLKVAAAPAIGEAVGLINELIDALDYSDVQTFARQVYDSSTAYDDYAKAVLDAAVADKQLTQAQADVILAHEAGGQSMEELEQIYGRQNRVVDGYTALLGLMTKAEYDAMKAAEDLTTAHEDVRLGLDTTRATVSEVEQALKDSAKTTDYARHSTEIWTEEIKTLAKELGMAEKDVFKYKIVLGYTDEELKKVADDLNITGAEFDDLADKTGISRDELERIHSEFRMGEEAIQDYADAIQEARDRYEDFYGTLAQGIVELRDLGEAQKKSAEEYEAKLAELEAKARSVYGSVKQEFERSLPDPTSVKDRLNMAGDAWDEWALRIQTIIDTGIASPWYAVLQEMGYVKPPDVGVRQWAEDLKTQFYEGELPQLINTQAQAWQENTATMDAAQREATAAYQREIGARKGLIDQEIADLQAARAEQLAAEQEARNEATIELALSLAEQTGMLQTWSQQRFGPDFSQVADSASEVLGLLDSGILTIDGALETLLGNTIAGVQNALDVTGSAADETNAKLNELASKDWAAEKRQAIHEAFDPEAIPLEDFKSKTSAIGEDLKTMVPDVPFQSLIDGFTGAEQSIMTASAGLVDGVTADFNEIDTQGSNLATQLIQYFVGQSAFPEIQAGSTLMKEGIATDFGELDSSGNELSLMLIQYFVEQTFPSITSASANMRSSIIADMDAIASSAKSRADDFAEAWSGAFQRTKKHVAALHKEIDDLPTYKKIRIELHYVETGEAPKGEETKTTETTTVTGPKGTTGTGMGGTITLAEAFGGMTAYGGATREMVAVPATGGGLLGWVQPRQVNQTTTSTASTQNQYTMNITTTEAGASQVIHNFEIMRALLGG